MTSWRSWCRGDRPRPRLPRRTPAPVGLEPVNLTAAERRWFAWAVLFAVLVGVVIGLGTAEWMVTA